MYWSRLLYNTDLFSSRECTELNSIPWLVVGVGLLSEKPLPAAEVPCATGLRLPKLFCIVIAVFELHILYSMCTHTQYAHKHFQFSFLVLLLFACGRRLLLLSVGPSCSSGGQSVSPPFLTEWRQYVNTHNHRSLLSISTNGNVQNLDRLKELIESPIIQ